MIDEKVERARAKKEAQAKNMHSVLMQKMDTAKKNYQESLREVFLKVGSFYIVHGADRTSASGHKFDFDFVPIIWTKLFCVGGVGIRVVIEDRP